MLEYAVRPFQTRDAQGRTLIPSISRGTTQRAMLIWGAESTLPPPVYGGISLDCCQQQTQEQSREGETVRINGSDGESYIDVFRANTLHLRRHSDSNSCLEAPWETSAGVASVFDGFSSGVEAGAPMGTTSGGANDCTDVMHLNNNTA